MIKALFHARPTNPAMFCDPRFICFSNRTVKLLDGRVVEESQPAANPHAPTLSH